MADNFVTAWSRKAGLVQSGADLTSLRSMCNSWQPYICNFMAVHANFCGQRGVRILKMIHKASFFKDNFLVVKIQS